jgi:peptide/nickel transport system substrate-binding protein
MRTIATPRRIGLVAAVVLALLAAACSSDGGDATSDTEPRQVEVATGGTATMVQPVDPATLDPTTVTNGPTSGSQIVSAIYDALFTVADDGTFEPRIATDFASDDGITWTMTLRDDVMFSDGTPLDADAVMAQWDLLKNTVRASVWSYFQKIDSMRVVDPTTFEVTLVEENRQFYRTPLINQATWIPSPTARAAAGEDFGNQPVGAGPFMLQSRTQGSETTLVRNPDYWQEGLPKLDTLVIRTINDPQQLADTILTGAAQGGTGVPDVAAQQTADAGLERVGVNTFGGGCFLFNDKQAPFDDIRARQAVYLAVDMEELNQTVSDGASETPLTLFPEGSPFYDPDQAFPEPDPDEAQRLFDELAAEGTPVQFSILTPGGDAQTRSTALQTQLAAYENVTAELNVVDGATYGPTLFAGDFQLGLFGLTGDDPEPQIASMSSDWPIPIASMGSPEIDQDIRDGQTATDLEGRKEAYDSLAATLNDIFKIKFMSRSRGWFVMDDTVSGVELYGQGTPLWENFGLVG